MKTDCGICGREMNEESRYIGYCQPYCGAPAREKPKPAPSAVLCGPCPPCSTSPCFKCPLPVRASERSE